MEEVAINQSDLSWERAPSYHEGTDWKVLRRGSEGEPKADYSSSPHHSRWMPTRTCTLNTTTCWKDSTNLAKSDSRQVPIG